MIVALEQSSNSMNPFGFFLYSMNPTNEQNMNSDSLPIVCGEHHIGNSALYQHRLR
jgi:hypothetical protein